MRPKFCLPILQPNWPSVVERVQNNRSVYDCFEIWLDYLDRVTPEEVQGLLQEYGERLILLFRRKQLEPIRLPLSTRKEIISMVANSEAYLDLDVSTQDEELDFVRSGCRPKLILSYHNYDSTPENEVLAAIVAGMKALHPDVYKIAAVCNSREEAIRLLTLLLRMNREQMRHIVLGMGEQGVITRIFGSLWGNEIIYAPLAREERSAPGQLTRGELQEIFDMIEPPDELP